MGRRGPRDDHRRAASRAGRRATRSSSATTPRSARSRTTSSPTSGGPLVDVRSPGEYSGELLHMPDYPQEGAVRGGHIPGAASVPWARAATEDGTFKPRADLRGHLPAASRACRPDDDVDRLLPHRRALQPHLVRAHPPARLRHASATTTAAGPSGATPCGCRSSQGTRARVGVTPARRQLRRARRRLRRRRRRKDRLQLLLELSRGAARAAGALRRRGRHDGAGARVPVAAVPGRRGRGRDGEQRRCTCSSRPRRRRPTTRGFASIMRTGLDGEPAADVLAVPDDFYIALGLGAGRQPAAAARHGGDARPDQEPGAGRETSAVSSL